MEDCVLYSSVQLGNEVFRFGGYKIATNEYCQGLWKSSDGLSWNEVITEGRRPEKRKGAAAIAINNKFFVLFGGANDLVHLNDLHLYSSANKRWYKGLSTSLNTPKPRAYHTLFSDGKGKIFMFGGENKNEELLNDIWVIDLLNESIYTFKDEFPFEYKKTQSTPIEIMGKKGATATVVKNYVYLYGLDARKNATECGMYISPMPASIEDGFTWSTIDSKCPPIRFGHSALRLNTDILYTGGCSQEEKPFQCYNDSFNFDTISKTWSSVKFDNNFTSRMNHGIFVKNNIIHVLPGNQLEINTIPDVSSFRSVKTCSEYCDNSVGNCSENDVCVCNYNKFGVDCQTDQFWGHSDKVLECNNHGKLNKLGVCECYEGFMGATCNEGQNICKNNCSNNGVCNNQSKCECYKNYYGEDCSQFLKCPSLCCNHGLCLSNGQCQCEAEYFGDSCSIPLTAITQVKREIDLLGKKLQSFSENIAKINNTNNSLIQLITNVEEKRKSFNQSLNNNEIAKLYFTHNECQIAPKIPKFEMIVDELKKSVIKNNSEAGKFGTQTGLTSQEQIKTRALMNRQFESTKDNNQPEFLELPETIRFQQTADYRTNEQMLLEKNIRKTIEKPTFLINNVIYVMLGLLFLGILIKYSLFFIRRNRLRNSASAAEERLIQNDQ